MAELLDILVEASATYLIAQLRAGADVVQLFESWAMNIDEHEFANWVIEPNRRIAEKVRANPAPVALASAALFGFLVARITDRRP